MNNNNLIINQRASVVVEVALIVPAILFLLLAGVTLANIVQLTRATDRVAALLADDISLRPMLDEADFDTALAAAAGLIDGSGFPAQIRLDIKAVEIDPGSSSTVIWVRNRGNGGEDCAPADPVLFAPGEGMTATGLLHFVQVDLCTTPTAGFFLSGFLSVADFTIHGRAFAVGRKAAIRSLE
ncbi:MAG: hypothetical protein WDZ54_06890 [Sneathiella sp.]